MWLKQLEVAMKSVARQIDHIFYNVGLDEYIPPIGRYFLISLIAMVPLVFGCILIFVLSDTNSTYPEEAQHTKVVDLGIEVVRYKKKEKE